MPPPPRSTLFPYTTLFRSSVTPKAIRVQIINPTLGVTRNLPPPFSAASTVGTRVSITAVSTRPRSEEHTSELQSHSDLVCRLLLEKKKDKGTRATAIDTLT